MGVTAHTSVDGAKLLVPERRRELVIRHRINALLDAADEHRVILIQAPAGYGKTSALIDWLAARSERVAWVSLDRWDNDVQRLAAHVVAACECTLPGTFADLQHALSGGSDLMQTCLPLLGNTLREHVDERLILVLDDYHVITDSRCHEFIRGCLDVMPLQVQTVLSSRTQPPLRLARRLAAGTLARIGSEQLRFTPSESEQLLNGSCELRLDPSELAEVDDRLKGWPAAVSLLALSLRIGGSQAGTAGERDLSSELAALTRGELADYVIEEILDYLPPAHHEFILRTAILERLNGPLCTAVLDDPGAPELLEDIRLSGQFVDAVDSAGGWLRVHDLIRSPLAVVLAQREPAIVPVLHRRASQWFQEAGMTEEAIDHALAAGDGFRAAQLLAANMASLLTARRYVTMRRALDATPLERGELGPFCEALDVILMLIEGVDQRITHERAEELITRYGDRPEVRMVVDPVLVTPYYGNVSRAAEAGREAVERYRDLPELQHQLAAQLAVTLWFSGDLTGARALAEPLVSTPGSLTTTVWARGVLALIAIEQDEPRLAERYARETAQAVTQAGADTAPEFAGVRAMLADALRVNGKLTEARVEIDYACALEEQRPGSIGHAFALLLDAQLALAERRRARGRASARRAREIFNQFPDVGATVTARLEAVEGALAGSADTASLGSMPSPAELRVLELLATGMKRSQIARELYVSDATVKSHLRRLFRRLGVNTRAEAINAARERRLLPSLESLPEPEEALSVRGARG